jgi:chromate reductase
MTILAISGSLRKNSSNEAILHYLSNLLPNNVEFIMYDGLAILPHFNPDLNFKDTPQEVFALRNLLTIADGVIICSPEYAFGIPGSLKNLLDWVVASGELADKPMALITASSVGAHAHEALKLILITMSAKLPDNCAMLIPFIRTKVSASGEITDTETTSQLQVLLQSFLYSISSPN